VGEARLALASGSPRRVRILEALGLSFRSFATGADETLLPGEEAAAAAERLARVKAEAGSARESLPVLAADTVVVLDGRIYGKPESGSDALRILGELQGRRHEVVTGVCLRVDGRSHSGVERTTVELAAMSRGEREWYVETGEPLDKAGAYNIEGLGALFVAAIEGSPSNVAGLPVRLLRAILARAGVDVGWAAAPSETR
jgi:septum formation protein